MNKHPKEIVTLPQYRISNKPVFIIIIILLFVIILLSYFNLQGEKLEEGRIRVKAGDHIIGEITIDEVKKLPAVNKKLVINSTAGLSKHNFTGVALYEVFNQMDPAIVKNYNRVITRGVDNYVSGLNMEEVLESNNVFLVYADNGKALKSKSGREGTMRIIILNDPYGQRFTNYLAEIELE